MKYFILFLLSFSLHAGTCTSDSFTSASANSILTSTKYNNDHSTIYNRLNGNFDGGCVTDGTIESTALNSTDFAALFEGIHQGCKVSRSSASVISVDKCKLTVGGKLVKTSAATTVSMGCGSCSAETTNTLYYVYATTSSTASALSLNISTTAPEADGLDGSGNRVLGKFINDASSDIATYAIKQWKINSFEDKPQLAVDTHIAATSNCTPNSASSVVGAFTPDTDCPGPTITRQLYGTWSTADTNLPQFTVHSLPPGYYEATMSAFTSTSGTTTAGLAINDGTTTCITTGAYGVSSGGAPATVVCTFYYSTIADRTFSLYGGAAAGSVTVLNSVTAPANGIKFVLKYLGEE